MTFLPISALDPADARKFDARVAGPEALLVGRIHKIYERRDHPDQLNDKDAHDVYRLLPATTGMAALATNFECLRSNPIPRIVTQQAIDRIPMLFANEPDALEFVMAGRAEEGVGDPDLVSSPEPKLMDNGRYP
jgi:hypothetical protein